MPRVSFPQVLQRHVACPPVDVDGRTVKEALDAAFAVYPTVRGYLFDDTGALRQHVTVFVDGQVVRDRTKLAQRVDAGSRIDVLQALSGG
ncbi:MAG TPA: MoaD/ThiS family protein [Planctomycetota bacterium]|nr:MoaD/ThiS family protein [Planctomycetota bacterium]